MRGFMSPAAAAAILAFTSTASAIQTITTKGNAFFAGNDRFLIRGVDYQPGGSSDIVDPLADATTCKRDIKYFSDLGINTIRVYTVDNSADHDECMQALEDAGIYLVLDVNTPTISINRDDPESTYTKTYLQHVFATVDVFAKYDNTMAFFAANEVVNSDSNTASMTYVKAVIRDMRAYIAAQVDRTIPVGYSAADISTNRDEQMKYLNCGDDSERSDFFAVNDYSWCGDSSFTESGWDKKVENYTDYSIPLFLSEFGCNEVTPRAFTEVKSLYSDDMSAVFSGGLVYEYSQESNNYGIVTINDDGTVDADTDDFKTLKKMYASTADYTGGSDYNKDGKASDCPDQTDTWEADSTLPDMPSEASAYLKNGAGTPLGDQNIMTSVPSSTGTATGSSSSGGSSSKASGSASASGTGSSDESGAAAISFAGLWVPCVVSLATIGGAMLVL